MRHPTASSTTSLVHTHTHTHRDWHSYSYKYTLTPRADTRTSYVCSPPLPCLSASSCSWQRDSTLGSHSTQKALDALTQMFCLPMLIGLNATQAHFSSRQAETEPTDCPRSTTRTDLVPRPPFHSHSPHTHTHLWLCLCHCL